MKNNFLNISVTNIYSKPSLNSEVTLPYLFGSPFDMRYKLNLIQKDSAFNTNENSIDID